MFGYSAFSELPLSDQLQLQNTVTATIARPNADVSNAGWVSTSSTLYDAIDEATIDDADYISTTSAASCEIGMSETAYPGGALQAITYRAASQNSSTVTMTLMCNGSQVATWQRQLTPILTTYQYQLTQYEVSQITSGNVSIIIVSS